MELQAGIVLEIEHDRQPYGYCLRGLDLPNQVWSTRGANAKGKRPRRVEVGVKSLERKNCDSIQSCGGMRLCRLPAVSLNPDVGNSWEMSSTPKNTTTGSYWLELPLSGGK